MSLSSPVIILAHIQSFSATVNISMRDVGWYALLASFFSQHDLDLTISTQSALLLSLLVGHGSHFSFKCLCACSISHYRKGWIRCEFKWIAQLHWAYPTEPPLSFIMITFITRDSKQVVIRSTLSHREMAWAPILSYSALSFICKFDAFTYPFLYFSSLHSRKC